MSSQLHNIIITCCSSYILSYFVDVPNLISCLHLLHLLRCCLMPQLWSCCCFITAHRSVTLQSDSQLSCSMVRCFLGDCRIATININILAWSFLLCNLAGCVEDLWIQHCFVRLHHIDVSFMYHAFAVLAPFLCEGISRSDEPQFHTFWLSLSVKINIILHCIFNDMFSSLIQCLWCYIGLHIKYR